MQPYTQSREDSPPKRISVAVITRCELSDAASLLQAIERVVDSYPGAAVVYRKTASSRLWVSEMNGEAPH